jgi:hypothetical protein
MPSKKEFLWLFMILVAVIFAVYETLPRPVPFVGASDPQIGRLKEFAVARHLHWRVDISADRDDYCASLKAKDDPYHFEVGCDPHLDSAVNQVIDKWNPVYGMETIDEGE